MSAYVTELKPCTSGRVKRYCHLTADTEIELDHLALGLGLHEGQRFDATAERAAYYTLTPLQRQEAIAAGARTGRAPAAAVPAAAGLFETGATR